VLTKNLFSPKGQS